MTKVATLEARRQDGAGPLEPGPISGFVGPKVRVLWNLLSARMVEALTPFGLRSGAYSTLALIYANSGCSQIELARGLGMDKSAVVSLIDDLESRGYASRVRSVQDRRRHALYLTKEGAAMMLSMQDPVAGVGRPIRDALTRQEMDQLLDLLDRAYQALVKAEAEAES